MNTKEKNALESFQSGWNCAQSVVMAFSEKLKFDKKLAQDIACGFGAGMGRLQETCGAVTGAFMALSVYNSHKYSDLKDQKEKSYLMIRQFDSKFIETFGSVRCKTLLNCDLLTEEGRNYFSENKLSKTVCEKCIFRAVEIVDELITEI
jgi:C_GCAxxG_C_C family probable redox protein